MQNSEPVSGLNININYYTLPAGNSSRVSPSLRTPVNQQTYPVNNAFRPNYFSQLYGSNRPNIRDPMYRRTSSFSPNVNLHNSHTNPSQTNWQNPHRTSYSNRYNYNDTSYRNYNYAVPRSSNTYNTLYPDTNRTSNYSTYFNQNRENLNYNLAPHSDTVNSANSANSAYFNQNRGNLNYNFAPHSDTINSAVNSNITPTPINSTTNSNNNQQTPTDSNVSENISGSFEVLGISGQDGNLRVVSRRRGNIDDNNLPENIRNQMNRLSDRFLNYINSNGLNIIELRENTTLETYQNTSSEEEERCTICHENISRNEIIRKINSCNHIFHQDCIDIWLETHNTCPLCRGNIVNNLPTETESPNQYNQDENVESNNELLSDNNSEEEVVLEIEETTIEIPVAGTSWEEEETSTTSPSTTSPSTTSPSATSPSATYNLNTTGLDNVINTITNVVSSINASNSSETDIMETITNAIQNMNTSSSNNTSNRYNHK